MDDNLAPERSTGGAMTVGLDFNDASARDEIGRLLDFAEIEVAPNPVTAGVVLGDGGNAEQFPVYIYLQPDADEPHGSPARKGADQQRICAKAKLSSLFSAFAKARSLQVQHQQFADADPAFGSYVGISNAAVRTRQLMATAGAADVTVLITGESGTGKEVVARALHAGSTRRAGPFVPINCGAIPAELLESELFGHERGAFTGAITQKTGRFELAHGGTLFLDEIGDMPYPMQVKMLRAIEQKSFERVGGAQTRVSDVRIVAATNIDLEARIEAGEFREDLYYRLNVFPIELSPLRERAEDIALLVDVLGERITQEQGLQLRLSQEALKLLQQYAWPGNVRELSNLLQRLAIQYPHAMIKSEDLPAKYRESGPQPKREYAVSCAEDRLPSEPGEVLLPVNGIDLKEYLTRLERSLIEQALDDSNAVVARAADRLHIRRTTLVEKMRKHGLGRKMDLAQ